MPTAANLKCPNCGAPLPVDEAALSGERIAICLYCDLPALLRPERGSTTVLRAPAPSGAQPSASEEAAAELGRRVKELVLAGRWQEAVALYAERTGTSEADAGAAIEQISRRLPGMFKILRQAPVEPWGWLLALIPLGAAAAALAVGIAKALGGNRAFIVLAAAGLALLLLLLRSLLPKLLSTLIFRFGPEGRGTVLRRALISSTFVKDGVVCLVHFGVQPLAAGEPAFEDEQALVIRPASVEKLQPGNVVRVRYGRRSQRVFPIAPIEVLESRKG